MKKICIFTGTRAEYGLLYWLIKGIHKDPDLELQLIVTGTHLSHEFGYTISEIRKDGFPISKSIEILLSSDTAVGVSKSVGLAQISFSEAFAQLQPDILVLLGDRTETFAAASCALIAGIPIAHIHGGELTEGAYDDALRHSITKMSHLHFAATELYRKRVIQLGEHPETVFNVGAIGLDNIKKMGLLDREEFEKFIDRKLLKHNLLITFHPVTLDKQTSEEQFQQLLDAVHELNETLLIFTKPNADKDGRIIISLIDEYVACHPEKSICFVSMGQLRYLSALKLVDAVVGNSSSGIIEAPILKTPTINIGDRQKGRIMGETIINCGSEKKEIQEAIRKALNFDRTVDLKNPYGEGDSSAKILHILKKQDTIRLKKKFFDLQFT